MDANEVWAISVALLALALLMFGGVLASRVLAQLRSGKTLSRALGRRASASAASAAASPGAAGAKRGTVAGKAAGKCASGAPGAQGGQGGQGSQTGPGDEAAAGRPDSTGMRYMLDRMADIGLHWVDTRIGQQLVAPEDRLLIDQCGFIDTRARGIFLSARVACGIGFPLLASFLLRGHPVGGPARY